MIAAYVSAATGRTIALPLDRARPPYKLGAMGVPEIERVVALQRLETVPARVRRGPAEAGSAIPGPNAGP
jgi:hypothetical protein